MKVLIDTNVILDYLLKRKHFDVARRVIENSPEDIEFYMTSNIVTDIYYIYFGYLTKKSREEYDSENDEFNRRRRNLRTTKEVLAGVTKFIDIINVSREDCIRAFYSEMEDYEDAVEVESALSHGIDRVITRDSKDYRASRIPAYSPEEFLALPEINTSQAA